MEIGLVQDNQQMLKGNVSNLYCAHKLLLLLNEQSPQKPNPLYILGRIPQQIATPSEQ
jgi:hypothetical protein